ncbi:MAG: cytochrome C [Bacteroidetes bacterium]|nr:cytochrome C [Bacteroidota bacterium]
MLKKIGYVLFAALVLIQFIRPERNLQQGPFPNDITAELAIPQDVNTILQQACYDCHSNNTKYPWYAQVQPINWWIQDHVNEGKQHLNFHAFATYTPKKKHHKLEEIAEVVTEGEMPMDSYQWMHGNTRLTNAQKTALVQWAKRSMLQYEQFLPKQ